MKHKTISPETKEQREAAQGERIAAALGLKRSREYPDRFECGEFGTKTALGVYRVMARLVDELG